LFCSPNYWGDQIKEIEVVGAYSMHVEMFRLECNIKIDLKGIGREDLYWFQVQFQVLVSTVMNLWVP
jgi:hypothetical protein